MNGSSCGGGANTTFGLANMISQASFVIFILILDVCGNCLVIGAILRYRRLRTITNYFIISLAVSDLLIAALSMSFRIHHTLKSLCWDLGETICEFWVFVDLLCSCASITNLSLISIDRFLALTFPLSYRSIMTKARAIAAIAFVWGYSGLLASLSFMNWSADASTSASGECKKTDRYYYTFAITAGFFLPLIILVINYSMVFKVAFTQAKKLQQLKSASSMEPAETSDADFSPDPRPSVISIGRVERKRRKSIVRELKATKTLAIVIGTFIVCWLPFFIIMFVVQFCDLCLHKIHPTATQFVAIVFVYVLPLLNSAVNPIIYSSFNSDFRSAFKDIFIRVCTICGRDSYTHRSSSGDEDVSVVTFFQSKYYNGTTPQIVIQEANSASEEGDSV
ncbi:tyramine/octopamine receptor-like [Orbicella faveolata]|uniref:tyramine/octopamine receptor-like n=1 Tax=Orbicella faveolata TaxID=48498 RepID=UPI0009E49CC7|nr:tyramine/octopamine receptor-like [Orbicella faveolata]